MDVHRELVSADAVRDHYGVVLDGDGVVAGPTRRLRYRMRAEREQAAQFDYGLLPEGLACNEH